MPGPPRAKRGVLPAGFSIDSATGDILATDLADDNIYRFTREQVRHMLAMDEALRRRTFDPTEYPIQSGYTRFRTLWKRDASVSCELAPWPEDGYKGVLLPSISPALVLPRREDDESQNPQTYRKLVTVAANAYLREQDVKSYHVGKRLQTKASRSAVAAPHSEVALSGPTPRPVTIATAPQPPTPAVTPVAGPSRSGDATTSAMAPAISATPAVVTEDSRTSSSGRRAPLEPDISMQDDLIDYDGP
ncbi:hypothetical protein C2E23DRAFT_858984 [Lenzites betulinus]|nr:hypothetical protein C2E23DRAFT_858984 [Lenzites betulinus]